MKIVLNEYNVTPDIDDRNQVFVKIEDDKIVYGNKIYYNAEMIQRINNLLFSYKESILRIKDVKHSNYKGGRQQILKIHFKEIYDKPIIIFGNTDNEEVSNFYNKLKNEIMSVLEK